MKLKSLFQRKKGTQKKMLATRDGALLCYYHTFHFGHGDAIAVEFFDEAPRAEVEHFLGAMRDKYDVWNCTSVGYGPRRVILDTRDDSALDPKFKNVSFNALFGQL